MGPHPHPSPRQSSKQHAPRKNRLQQGDRIDPSARDEEDEEGSGDPYDDDPYDVKVPDNLSGKLGLRKDHGRGPPGADGRQPGTDPMVGSGQPQVANMRHSANSAVGGSGRLGSGMGGGGQKPMMTSAGAPGRQKSVAHAKHLDLLGNTMDLCCTLEHAQNLPKADTFGTIDPYVTLTIVEGNPKLPNFTGPTVGRGRFLVVCPSRSGLGRLGGHFRAGPASARRLSRPTLGPSKYLTHHPRPTHRLREREVRVCELLGGHAKSEPGLAGGSHSRPAHGSARSL